MSTTEATDSLDLLVAATRHWPLLTATEELRLARRIERGDLAARERLIMGNIRLVISIARRYQGDGLMLPDLVQEGMFGLIRATEKFDWRRGFRFSTYATWWIRRSIQRGLENTGRTIRLPANVAQHARRLKTAEGRLTTRLGRAPTDAELAEATGFAPEQITTLRGHQQTPASLDALVSVDGDTPLGELIGDERGAPGDDEEDDTLADALTRAMAVLTPGERRLIGLRYAGDPCSVREAATRSGLSIHKARQLEAGALRRLAECAELRDLRAAA